MRGRRDEVEFLPLRMQAAARRGRFKDADALTDEWQERMAQASRGLRTGEGLVAEAIDEALAGLADVAEDRVDDARAEGLLTDATLDEQLMLAAVTQDAAASRALLPAAVAEMKKSGGENPREERVLRGLAALAESRPGEASRCSTRSHSTAPARTRPRHGAWRRCGWSTGPRR